ncbi:MAG: DUF971 domain-containing protein [Deltaproteobacteria bacterium]|nr:MAG: DUF971 domain-containing protein [Deltaproteobacteria bacterium]
MMQPSCTPAQVTIRAAAEAFVIRWEDGHTSLYPLWYLRGLCPCASCQGHGGEVGFVEDAARLGEVDEVGNYGLRLVWNDTHKTGIYDFNYLRALCPCRGCRAQGKQAHLASVLPPKYSLALEAFLSP